MNRIRVSSAEYVGDSTLRILFSDGFQRDVDFGDFIRKHPHPQYDKYLNQDDFKQFSIEFGNIVWGDDWDLVFPIESLYSGDLA